MLALHPRIHLHYTSTHAIWVNLIEVWLSILARAALAGASFASVHAQREVIDRFLAAWKTERIPLSGPKKSCTRCRSRNVTLVHPSEY